MSQPDFQTLKYIRETVALLETTYDREAMNLICSVGIFAVDDSSELGNAVERLRGKEHGDGAIASLQKQAVTDATPSGRQLAVNELEERYHKELSESIDSAYLLGIAVGRRIGSAPLRLAGGAR